MDSNLLARIANPDGADPTAYLRGAQAGNALAGMSAAREGGNLLASGDLQGASGVALRAGQPQLATQFATASGDQSKAQMMQGLQQVTQAAQSPEAWDQFRQLGLSKGHDVGGIENAPKLIAAAQNMYAGVVDPNAAAGRAQQESQFTRSQAQSASQFQQTLNKPVEQTYGATLINPLTGQPVSGQPSQQQSDVTATVAGIKAGNLPVTSLGRSPRDFAVKAQLAREGFDATTAQLDLDATKKNIASMNSTGQLRLRQAVDFAGMGLDKLEELSNQWNAGNYPILNKVNMAAALQGLKGPEAQSLARQIQSQLTDIQGDVATIYKGGNSPTDQGLQKASQILDLNDPRQTVTDGINLIRQNLQYRKASLNQIAAGVGSSNPYQPGQSGAAQPQGQGGAAPVAAASAAPRGDQLQAGSKGNPVTVDSEDYARSLPSGTFFRLGGTTYRVN